MSTPAASRSCLLTARGNVAALPRTTRIENTFTCLGGRKGRWRNGVRCVRGGGLAIEESPTARPSASALKARMAFLPTRLEDAFPGLVEQVMGEASLYASPCCSGIEAGLGLMKRRCSAARVSLDA